MLLTDGARSVWVIGRSFELELPVPPVAVVDTVGSGDAFGGAFLAWWVEQGLGRDGLADQAAIRDAVTRAIEVASLTCQRPGRGPAHTYRRRLARPVTGVIPTNAGRLSGMRVRKRLLAPFLLAGLALAITAPGVFAVTVRYPTQSLGNRGADVRAIQATLISLGYPMAFDGVYGTATMQAVKSFQAAARPDGLGHRG